MGLMAPALLLTCGLAAVPILSTVVRAVSDGGTGLSRLLAMPDFWPVMGHTLIWTVVSVAGGMVIGYAGAFLLQSRSLRLVGLWRSLIMIPWIIPGVVGATVWRWMLSSEYGILNQTLINLGVLDRPVQWLSDPNVVIYAVAMVQMWVTAPFAVLMVSAALAGIPDEQYEAARLDGASRTQILWHIVLPTIRATTGIVVLNLTIWALNSFTIIWITTSGGPAGSSTILPILLYQAFQNGDQSLTAAIAVLQLVVCVVLALAYIRSMKTDLEEQS
jgi:multiple sugar transport system permease protein